MWHMTEASVYISAAKKGLIIRAVLIIKVCDHAAYPWGSDTHVDALQQIYDTCTSFVECKFGDYDIIDKTFWTPSIGEQLTVNAEDGNSHDQFVVILSKPGFSTVGHVLVSFLVK